MKTLLVSIDFSPTTDHVVAEAMQLASATGASVRLLYVIESVLDMEGWDYVQQHQDEFQQQYPQQMHDLNQYAIPFRQANINVEEILQQGPPVAVTLWEAEQCKADTIVIGSHGHGAAYNLLIGSVGEGILRHAPCPVLVVPDPVRHA